MVRKIFITTFVLMLIFLFVFRDLVWYGLLQGQGQLKILLGAENIESVIKNSKTSDSLIQKLKYVNEIRQFAFEKIELDRNENYTTFYNHGDSAILWIVRACEPYSLTSKEWSFPFVGKVSYKGYFDLNRAKRLRSELIEEGYDTYIREVTAWSTLGWFKDPILSGMLRRSEGDLANTIIHELTHGTLFIENQLDFNENLASYVGDKGAEQYLEAKYGKNSRQYTTYIQNRVDRNAIFQHFLGGARYLDSIYTTMSPIKSMTQKQKIKENAIDKIISSIDTLTLYDSTFFRNRYKGYKPNNAYFMSYKVYRGKQDVLDSLYYKVYSENLSRMISGFKKMTDSEISSLVK